MNTFYSIIKVTTNTLANDSLSIGILLHDGKQFRLQFSDERKHLAKKLLDKNADIVDFVSKQVQKKVEEMNVGLTARDTELFAADSILSSEHFAHISQYSNGVLRFSEPLFLNDEMNEEKFQSLFHALIGSGIQKLKINTEEQERAFKARINRSLLSRVAEKVHTNLNLSPDQISGLFFPFHIDCIGLNGSFTAAKSVSFHRTAETVGKEISHYSYLIQLLQGNYQRKNEKSDHFYLIAEEPSDIRSKEHQIWEDLSFNPFIKRIFPEQIEKVAMEIEERKARKFLI